MFGGACATKNIRCRNTHSLQEEIRMKFTIGQKVQTPEGLGVITETRRGVSPMYKVFLRGNQEEWCLEEVLHCPDVLIERIRKPEEWDDPEDYALQRQALEIRRLVSEDMFPVGSQARLTVLPHQIATVARVVQSPTARFVLADEVGLGKTIEAGLILQELRVRGIGDRVLIVTPASLTRQWEFELRTKFNDPFRIMDVHGEKWVGGNPWRDYGRVVASAAWLVREEQRKQRVLEAQWDVLVVDEAHHARSHTQLGKLLQQMTQRTPSVLLLTASPLQLGYEDLYDVLSLVDPLIPMRWPTPNAFSEWYEDYRPNPRLLDRNALNVVLDTLRRWDESSLKDKTRVKGVLEWTRLYFRGLEIQDPLDKIVRIDDADNLSLEAMNASATRRQVGWYIQDSPLLPTRRVIRHRKRDLSVDTAQRTVRMHDVYYRESERAVYEWVTEYVKNVARYLAQPKGPVAFLLVIWQKLLTSSTNALAAAFRKRLNQLDQQQALRNYLADIIEDADDEESVARDYVSAGTTAEREFLTEALRRIDNSQREGPDTKVEQLLDDVTKQLADDASTRIVVFTQFLHTQDLLMQTLQSRGVSCVAFHGGLSGDEKEAAVRKFRNEASVLVSTESGGEGRNLQFAHIVMNYDLPWNPMRIEQRIGRVDRIGQRRSIEVHNYRVWKNSNTLTLDGRILDLLHQRLDCFQTALGPLDPILGDTIEERIRETWLTQGEAGVDAMQEDLARLRQQAEEHARDDLLTGPYAIGLLDAAAEPQDKYVEQMLESLMRKFFRRYLGRASGPQVWIEHTDVITIHLPDAFARRHRALKEAYRGTFLQDLAQTREDLDLFRVGHPLVEAVLEDCLTQPHSGDDGYVAVIRTTGTGVPTDQWICELLVRYTFKGFLTFETSQRIRLAWSQNTTISDAQALALDQAALKAAEYREVPPALWEHLDDLYAMAYKTAETHRKNWETGCRERQSLKIQGWLGWHEAQYRTKERELTSQLAQLEKQLAQHRQSADPKQRQIIPAEQGRVDHLQNELAHLKQAQEAKKAEAEAWKETEAHMTPVGLGLVVITAD